jgi:hypothetical protein
MAHPRRVELDDLVNRPGSYYNPQTEVLVVVDDSPEIDAEIFERDEFEGADWIQISDETPVDETERDDLIHSFELEFQAGASGSGSDEDDDYDEDEEDDLDPDPDPDEEEDDDEVEEL